MSSAILYLAIVAIWAGILVPRWLHPAQPESHQAEDDRQDLESGTGDDAASHDLATPGAMAGAASRRRGALAETDRPGLGGRGPAITGGALPHGVPGNTGATTRGPSTTRRAQILRARRRTLATLCLLTATAFAMVAARLAAWWIVVPPVLMLAGLLALLRTAARIDIQRAASAGTPETGTSQAGDALPPHPEPGTAHSGPAAPQATAHERGTEPDHQTRVAPTADVIDLSARIEEQPYDQYRDAEARAIGD